MLCILKQYESLSMRKKCIILLLLCIACGKEQAHKVHALANGKQVLGMILVKQGELLKLRLALCQVHADRPVTTQELAKGEICWNPLQQQDGTEYYFSELANKQLHDEMRNRGLLKAGAMLLAPIGVGAVGVAAVMAGVGRIRSLENLLSALGLGAISGLILEFPVLTDIMQRGWGRQERKLYRNWDSIFVVHWDFNQQNWKVVQDKHAIREILLVLADRLGAVVALQNKDTR